MSKIVIETCPLIKDKCRHCSIEHVSRPFTRIEKDKTTGLFKPAGLGSKKTEIGEYCNDAGKFVAEMHYCPVRYDQTKDGADYGLMKKKVSKPAIKKHTPKKAKVKKKVNKKANKKVRKLVNKKPVKKITRKKK